MAEGRGREQWAHTSQMLAWIGNCHAGKRLYQPADFNPYTRRQATTTSKLSKEASQVWLKAIFMGKRKGKAAKDE